MAWKTIAKYLGKDTSTATRWESNRGMPVYRVPGGKKATVYAYADEIDAWLRNQPDDIPQQSADTGTLSSAGVPQHRMDLLQPDPTERRKITFPRLLALGAGFALLIALIGFLVFVSRRPHLAQQVSFSGSKLLALDERGQLVWEYEFPQRLEKLGFESAQKTRFVDLNNDGRQELIIITAFADEGMRDIHREVLYCFSPTGEMLWKYEPKVTLSFRGHQYEGPWLFTDVLIPSTGNTKSIWVSVTHHTWWPSFIVKLDLTGQPTVEFVNSGGTYALSYVCNDTGSYVLAGGLNNEYNAATLAILDENQAPAASPQSQESSYKCDSYPEGQVYRYFLFPRSELNLLEGGPYNRVRSIRVFEHQIELSSDEVALDAPLLYVFSNNLDIKSVSMSDGYAELHRRLEQQGKIEHTLQECPALKEPYKARVWDEQTGWVEVAVPWVGGQRR